jgi:hypothetical protein
VLEQTIDEQQRENQRCRRKMGREVWSSHELVSFSFPFHNGGGDPSVRFGELVVAAELSRLGSFLDDASLPRAEATASVEKD